MLRDSVPSAAAVAVPSGIETKLQHVPVQLTRLPTTVDHSRSTGTFGVNPVAAMPTLVLIGPDCEARLAVAPETFAVPASCSVVFASSVGATFAGQSIRAFGLPASLVTVN